MSITTNYVISFFFSSMRVKVQNPCVYVYKTINMTCKNWLLLIVGDTCDQDIDGCKDLPCQDFMTNCTDLSPEEEVMVGNSFECGECPDGWVKKGGTCLGRSLISTNCTRDEQVTSSMYHCTRGLCGLQSAHTHFHKSEYFIE